MYWLGMEAHLQNLIPCLRGSLVLFNRRSSPIAVHTSMCSCEAGIFMSYDRMQLCHRRLRTSTTIAGRTDLQRIGSHRFKIPCITPER